MNILYVTLCDFEATTFGGEQRTRLLYEALQQIGDVYVLHLVDREEKVDSRHWKFRFEHQHGLKRVFNGLWFRCVKTLCPKAQAQYYPFHLLPDIDHFFPGVHFDVVVSRHLDFANSMHLWRVAPLFVDLDDHPMEVFRTCFLPSIPLWRRSLAIMLQRFMIWIGLCHAAGIWVANPAQERLVSHHGRTSILPNIPFSLPNLMPDCIRHNYVMTVGKMNYEPNFEGVDCFIREVWTQVHKKFPDMRYLVIGKGVPEPLAEVWRRVPGVSVLGFVEDLTELYEGALATVVPIFSGSGTCIKVLESLAYSRICLSSKFGVRGIPDADVAAGKCGIFVFNNAADLITHLERIVCDVKWRGCEEEMARNYVTSHYSREQFFKEVRQLIEKSFTQNNGGEA